MICVHRAMQCVLMMNVVPAMIIAAMNFTAGITHKAVPIVYAKGAGVGI